MTPAKRTAKIAELNDLLRKTMSVRHGRVMLTAGFAALPLVAQITALEAIRNFDGWNEDNDPHKERDFCSVDVLGRRIFAKIDYYDKSMEYGSEDPADPLKTTRVLVVMNAEEY